MQGAFFIRFLPLSALVLVVLVACVAPEVLLPRSAAVPPGVDLSGRWIMRPGSKRGQPGINEAINRTDGVDNKTIRREMSDQQRRDGARPGRGESKGGLVGIFLKTADSLKIEQTPHALFVNFDRAVTREYRFGENRPVNIGQANAHRVSGWDGDTYVIETLGEKRMKLTDEYSRSAEGKLLTRRITFRSRAMEEVTIVQEFELQED